MTTDYNVKITADHRDADGFGQITFAFTWKGGIEYAALLHVQKSMITMTHRSTPSQVQCLVDWCSAQMPRSNYAPTQATLALDPARRTFSLRSNSDRFRLQGSRKTKWDQDRLVTPFQMDEVIMPTLQQLGQLITNLPDVVAWDLKNRYNSVKLTYERNLSQYRQAEASMLKLLDEFALKGLAVP